MIARTAGETSPKDGLRGTWGNAFAGLVPSTNLVLVAMDKEDIINGVAIEVVRFVKNRRDKLDGLRHTSMAVNPFLNPLIMELNGYDDLDELSAFLVGGHLLDGHATGFGKLVDERILPNVFGTKKLTGPFRRENPPYDAPMFGVIDHIMEYDNGGDGMLALKAGRWSIQLGQALNMNSSFARMLDARERGEVSFDRIVIGVLYGTEDTLTDKFRVATGVGPHDVVHIRDHVDTYAGRRFWAWLNDGVDETQEWVMDGFLAGMDAAREELGSAADAVEAYRASYREQLARHLRDDRTVDWHALLREVNG